MFSFHRIALFGIAIALMAGCGYKNTAPQSTIHIDSPFNGHGPLINFDDTVTVSEAEPEPYEFEKYGTIDLFGIKLVGSIEPIIVALDSIPYIDIISDNGHKYRMIHDGERVTRYVISVLIDDIPFTMHVEYLKTEPILVDQVYFITSDTDDYICKTIVERLGKYYGLPDVMDVIEDTYGWYKDYDFHIRFRHLHSDEGGWIFFFVR